MTRRLGLVLLSLALTATAVPATSSGAVAAAAEPTVVGKRVIGHSVQGRPIVAYRLGKRGKKVPTVVLISTMHGNEPATRQILQELVDGEPVRDLDLWVVPTYNPDGLAAGTRKSARGVDLNRNYPYRWADLDGNYESGRGPASEPETKAMMGFLRTVRPDHVLSFHQPLDGVDTDTKNAGFARRVAKVLGLPAKTFDCGGVCHGTMTGWYNDRFRGDALTVEYGARPSRRSMRKVAPERVLRVFRAWRGYRTVEESPNR
ncbi:MAG TPA: M14 family zinc carboxypeptidase [Nocardioides sp.]|uniref:M14 family zinc carboxypeptidase n=1 Tax=Nocardioides sp. TaxID=35761 RepID=UPI002BDE4F95|nr:M14 family zinc carboxypeptidase [Nocardioides sp.]HTW15763.1 M14 family zinc carboxypeptidase [Nocardioides sp.]